MLSYRTFIGLCVGWVGVGIQFLGKSHVLLEAGGGKIGSCVRMGGNF